MKLIIDSALRDISKYPNEHSFEHTLERSYNLSKARLSSLQLMSSDYIINSNNNIFSITLSATIHICTLRIGTWSASDYASILQTDLNNSANWDTDPSLTFTVTYDSNFNKYTIGSSSAINLNFQDSKLATKLGFSKQQTTSLTSHLSDRKASFFNSKYYQIIIKKFQREISDGLNDSCFARVQNNVNPNELLNYQEYYYKNIVHLFNGDFTTPKSINIELRDENYDLVSLGTDFYFEIDIDID